MPSRMQIVIPMSGFGERFRRAGYALPKPLIEVDGKPIIAHVLDMFPGESDIIFICNREHLDEPVFRMAEILASLCPTGRIRAVDPHKRGPVHAVQMVASYIDPERPVVVNYCDFTCLWDWSHFKRFVAENDCDGALPAYRGFHPHSLGTTNYAYIREQDGWAYGIREKQPWTKDRMQEFASSGTYYFASGKLMADAFDETVAQNLHVNGEHYVSLAYLPMFARDLRVAVYPLQHFMQWGTPEDLAEYRGWSAAFRGLLDDNAGASASMQPRGSIALPMAGMGERFRREGYQQAKPVIAVSGRPMVMQAVASLPSAANHSFVLRAGMPGLEYVAAALTAGYPDAALPVVERLTEGQACTAAIGLDALTVRGPIDSLEPVTFGACDFGCLYDTARLDRLFQDEATDVIVWGVRGNANAVRRPHMFGWIATGPDSDLITHVSVKQPLEDPVRDPIVLGTFTFRRASDFRACLGRLIARDGRINGEFYLDSCVNDAIALGLTCRLFVVDHYFSWGTPDDLRTFEYWQSCFHQWSSHPYTLENDRWLPAAAVVALETRYRQPAPRTLARDLPRHDDA